jgi:hypothetical protein
VCFGADHDHATHKLDGRVAQKSNLVLHSCAQRHPHRHYSRNQPPYDPEHFRVLNRLEIWGAVETCITYLSTLVAYQIDDPSSNVAGTLWSVATFGAGAYWFVVEAGFIVCKGRCEEMCGVGKVHDKTTQEVAVRPGLEDLERRRSDRERRKKEAYYSNLHKQHGNPAGHVSSPSENIENPMNTGWERGGNAVWKEVVDKNSGKTYYVNRQTRATTWDRPPELDAAGGGGGGGGDESLPFGWVERTHEGRAYYVNTCTRESRWTRPLHVDAQEAALADQLIVEEIEV